MSKDIARAEINRVNAALKQNKPANAQAFAALATGRLTSNDSGWIGKNEPVGGLGNNQPLSQWIFAAKQGDISDPIGTSQRHRHRVRRRAPRRGRLDAGRGA